MMAPPCIALTVDVEADWGGDSTRGIEVALPRLLELLDRYEASATFFVVGALAQAFHHRLPEPGRHEVASHGMTHRVLTQLSRSAVQGELVDSRQALTALGYDVRGFRAPFLRRPPDLDALLAASGYDYDGSAGSLWPSPFTWLRRRSPPATCRRSLPDCAAPPSAGDPARAVPPARVAWLPRSTLRDRITPFNLTWLRLYHPIGERLLPRRDAVFLCHLHELLDGAGGWRSLPRPLRRLHACRAGAAAWGILERLLAAPRRRFVSCRTFLAATGWQRAAECARLAGEPAQSVARREAAR